MPPSMPCSAYREAIARHAPGTKILRFDLAVVVLWPWTNRDRVDRLAGLMRGIGLDRFSWDRTGRRARPPETTTSYWKPSGL